MTDTAAERMYRALVAASLRAPRNTARRMSKLFVEDSMSKFTVNSDAAAELLRQVNTTRINAPGLVAVDHLIDACGDDSRRLAGLALIMATSAFGLGCVGYTDRQTLDQVEVYQRAVAEIQKRLAWQRAEVVR